LSLALFSSNAGAANWVRISNSDTGTIGYVDTDSIVVSGSTSVVWLRWDSSKDKTKKAAQSKEQYQVSCVGRTLKILHWVDYGSDGRVLGSGPKYPSLQDAEPAVPDTAGETIVKTVCN